jgi:hypothetical protein
MLALEETKMKNGKFLKQFPQQTKEKYIVDKLIRRNRLIVGASIPGEGKSLVGMGILYSIAYGAPCLGEKVTAGSVMFIDSENRHDVLRDRALKIKRGLELDGHTMQGEVDFQHYSGFLLDDTTSNKRTWQPIIQAVKDIKPALIMLDHLLCFHQQDEDKSAGMNKVANSLEELMAIEGSSLLVLHHFNKNQGTFFKRLRGSSVIYARSDAAYEFRALSRKDGRLEKVGLIPQSRKDITVKPIRIKVDEGADWIKFVHDGDYHPIDDPKMDRLYHDIFHLFTQSRDSKSVYDVKNDIAGYASDTEIRDSLRGLEDKGLLDKKLTGSNKYMYMLGKVKKCPWCSP